MHDKENIEYVELLEKSLLVLHQKQVYQQQIIDNPGHPQKEAVLSKIEALQDEIETIILDIPENHPSPEDRNTSL